MLLVEAKLNINKYLQYTFLIHRKQRVDKQTWFWYLPFYLELGAGQKLMDTTCLGAHPPFPKQMHKDYTVS